ncbi:MAG: hypothetical protein ACJ763_11325 [Bdellovibrionia bacterium]
MRRITHKLYTTGILAAATMSVALPTPVWAQDDAQSDVQEVPQEGQVRIETVGKPQVKQQQTPEEAMAAGKIPAQEQTQAQTQVPTNQQQAGENGAWSNWNPSQAGTAETNMQGGTPTTMAQAEVREPNTLRNEVFALRPNAGAIVYHDTTDATTTRAIYGLTADWNFAGAFTDNPTAFVGLSTGGLFSHLGSATSDFWGSSPSSVVNSPGANMLIIPANLKVGVNMGDAVRLSARGGGNVLYRSEGVSMNVGPSTATTSQIWRVYPNVGGDLDIGLARGVTLGLRPDYTFTPGGNLFVGTVALGVSIG